MEQLPILLPGHWIDILLPQKTDLICFFQLVDGNGIGAEFSVIELDGALVLLSAMDGFGFFISLNLLADSGGGNRQPNQDHCGKKKKAEQQVALLSVPSERGNVGLFSMIVQSEHPYR